MGAYADDPQLANALNRKQIMGGGGARGNPGAGGGTQMSPPVYSNPVAPVRTPMPVQGGGGDTPDNPGANPGGTAFGPGGPIVRPTPIPTPPTPAGGGWGVDKPNPNPNPPHGGGNGGDYDSDPVRYPGRDPRDPLGPPAVRKPRYTIPDSGTTKDTGSYINPRSAGRPRRY